VGQNVREFAPGDAVFGDIPGYRGGFAEFVCVPAKNLIRKPAGLTFEQAAAIPQAGVIALRAIREKGHVQPGQKVLINGAGGSAGSFAVQLARLYGAEVTGVDSPEKADFLHSLGASSFVDYTREDFTATGKQYDLILDLIANRSAFAYKRALRLGGTYFFVGGSIGSALQILLFGPWIKATAGKHLRFLAVPQNRKDLQSISELCEVGKVIPAIDRLFSLERVAEAMRYVIEGRARGKIVVTIE
jgi:NADPH:quinone reductase-like Zn-dependent oxidoreductase